MIERDKWYAVKEDSRTYTFPGGDRLTFRGVTHIRVSPNGTHFFETADGGKHFMAKNWLHVEIHGEWIDGHSR